MAPAGRPKMGKEKKRRVNLMLEPATYEYLRRVGQGSASAGIGVCVLLHAAGDLAAAVKKLPMSKAKRK